MHLKEIIATIDTDTRAEAEVLMKNERFMSLKDFGDGYEAFIAVTNGALLPQVVLGDDCSVTEYECQCCKRRGKDICVHVAAVLLGVEKMLEAGCYDYHEAVKKLEQH